MAGDNRLDLIIALRDLVTAPLRRLQGMLQGLTQPLDAIRNAAGRVAGVFQKIGVLGGIIGGLSLAGPIAQAAQFESILVDTAITAGKTGAAAKAAVAEMSRSFGELSLKTGQSSKEIARGAQVMSAANLSPLEIDQFLPDVALVTTAAGAVTDEIGKMAATMNKNMGVQAKDMKQAMAGLVVAGKMGSFELKEMSKEFPKLTASAKSLGLEGTKGIHSMAAALQVARTGAGAGEEAANNFNNFLSKILSGDSIKNFKKMGVDITKVIESAGSKQIDPIEAVIQKIDNLLGKGSEASRSAKLNSLFADMQVQGFIKSMLQQKELYKAVRSAAQSADSGVIDADAATRINTIEGKLSKIKELSFQLINRIGNGFAPLLDPAIKGFETLHAWIADLDKDFPGLVDNIISVGGVVLAVVVGAAALCAVIGPLAAGFEALGAVAAVALSPIGLVLGLLAFAVWRKWDVLKERFQALWSSITAIFRSAVGVIKALFSGDGFALKAAWAQLKADLSLGGKNFKAILSGIGDSLGEIWESAWEGLKTTTINVLGSLLGAMGVDTAKATQIMEGVGKAFETVKKTITDVASSLIDMICGVFRGDGKKVGAALVDGWASLGGLAYEALGAIIEAVMGVVGLVAEIDWGAVWKAYVGFWTDIGKFIYTLFDGALGRIKDRLMDWANTSLKEAVDSIKNIFKGITDTYDEVTGTINQWGSGVATGAGKAWDSVTGVFGGGNEDKTAPAPQAPLGPVAPLSKSEFSGSVKVVVSADKGTTVESAKTDNPGAVKVETGGLFGFAF